MIKASLVGLVSALSAQSVASAAIPTTVSATTSLHSTAVLKQSPSGTKWLSFPTANTHHHELRHKFSVTRSAPVATTTASLDFFTVHRDALELHPACEMVLVSERTNPSSTLGNSLPCLCVCIQVVHTQHGLIIMLCYVTYD
jgi:hypothetical protein